MDFNKVLWYRCTVIITRHIFIKRSYSLGSVQAQILPSLRLGLRL